jgi:hypothetical protein
MGWPALVGVGGTGRGDDGFHPPIQKWRPHHPAMVWRHCAFLPPPSHHYANKHILRWSASGRTVGLAPNTDPPYTGTRWEVVRRNPGTYPPSWWLKCLADIPGPQWLDGRTGNGTVGLAPTRSAPYTGTRWEITRFVFPNEPTVYSLKCLADVPGPRMLRGYPFRPPNGTVGLVDVGFSLWKVTILPQ